MMQKLSVTTFQKDDPRPPPPSGTAPKGKHSMYFGEKVIHCVSPGSSKSISSSRGD